MASSGRNTRETGDRSSPTEQVAVMLRKGYVSPDLAMELVKVSLNSSIPDDQLYGAQVFLGLVEIEAGDSYYFAKIIETGMLKKIVQLLEIKNGWIQKMVTDSLEIVCSGPREHCEAVVHAGAVLELIKLLWNTDSTAVANNCLRCLYSIAYDFKTPDVVLRQGIIPALIEWTKCCTEIYRIRRRKRHILIPSPRPKTVAAISIVNLYSILCAVENPEPDDLSALEEFLPFLNRVLIGVKDSKTLASACNAVVGLATNIEHGIPAVTNSGICNRLAKLLLHREPLVTRNALKALRNVSQGSDACNEKILKTGVLREVSHILKKTTPDGETLEHVYRLICNLCHKNWNNIQQIIDARLMPGIIQQAKDGEANAMLDAVTAISNVADKDGGSLEQFNILVEDGAMEALCHQLNRLTDEETLCEKFNALGCILDRAKDQLVDSTETLSLAAVNRVVNAGAVPEIIRLFCTSENFTLVKACLCCMLSITSDINNRGAVFPEELIMPLLKRAENCLKINGKKIATGEAKNAKKENDLMTSRILRLYRNLCKYENGTPLQSSVLEEFTPVLTRILSEFQNSEILNEACEALIDLARNGAEAETAKMESSVWSTLAKLLTHNKPAVARNALRVALSLSDGSKACKEQILKCGVLPKLVLLLDDSADNDVVESIYMLIGNLLEGIPGHIQPVIKANLFPKILQAAKEKVFEVRIQAIKAIETVASKGGGSLEQVNYLLEQGALQTIYHQLSVSTEDEIFRDRLIKMANFLEHVRKHQNLSFD